MIQFILRYWNLDDLDNLVKFANNKKIADKLTDAFPHPYKREDGIAYITNFGSDKPQKVFAIEVNGIACGSIGILPLISYKIESPRAHSPLLAAGLASKNSNSYGIEESSLLAARFFNFRDKAQLLMASQY